MAPFFNANPESPDLQLLPASLRKDEELAVIAADVEAAILAVFTITIVTNPSFDFTSPYTVTSVPSGAYALDAANGVYVCLRGFQPEPAECPPLLLTALKREIAAAIRWRRAQWRGDPTTASESDGGQGGKAKSFRDDKLAAFPPTFGAHLRPYDIRPPATVI